MPRRRRRRITNRRLGSVSLAEFYFYCKQNNQMTEAEYEVICEKLNGGADELYWTNNFFAETHSGFILFKDFDNVNADEDFSAKVITFPNIDFTPAQFENVKHIIGEKLIINFPLTSDEVGLYEDIVYNKGHYLEKLNKPVETKEELKQLLIETGLLNNWKTDGYDNDWKDFTEIINLVFDDEIDLKKPIYKINRSGYISGFDVLHILSVKEKRFNDTNYRIVFCGCPKYHDEISYQILIFNDEDKYYYQMDEGRLFFKDNNGKYFFLTTDLNEYIGEKLIVNLNLFKSMSRNINQVMAPTEYVITPTMYNFYKERVVNFEDGNSDRHLNDRDQAIVARYKKLIMENRTVKLNGALITKDKITIDNQLFEIEFPPKFLNLYNNFGTIKKHLTDNNVRYNFNRLYEALLEISTFRIIRRDYTRESEYKEWTGCTFKVNGMEISVMKINNRLKINGIFCRVDDVYHVLTKAICYTDVEEYEKYIREVSHIGVEWKRMISNGILIKLRNPFMKAFNHGHETSGGDLLMRFSLLWDTYKRNRVYLSLNNKKYLIKYKTKFKKFFNLPSKITTITALKSELKLAIPDLDNTMIIDIVENAVEEAKIVKNRGEELVKNTLKDIGAKETEIVVRGNKIQGFLLTGTKTKAEYFIQKVSLGVYKYMDGSWNQRCVVDDHRKQRIYEDRLANRLVNIYNEPDFITTI